jgi:hypothetical protein
VSPKSAGKLIYCFKGLDLKVEVTHDGNPIALQPAHLGPYGHSTECTDWRLEFRATPGTELRINVMWLLGPGLPAGEFILVGAWCNTKDKLVGISLQKELPKFLLWPFVAGIISTAWAVYRLVRN